MKNYPDMHTHSTFSHDGKSTIREMREAECAKDVPIFAVTDHCDFCHIEDRDVFGAIQNSVTEVKKLSEEGSKILSGVEISDGRWYEKELKKLLSEWDFDLAIGSVHHVDYRDSVDSFRNRDFTAFTKKERAEFLHIYFNEVARLFTTFDFQILGHLTIPYRYIVGRDKCEISEADFREQIEEILRECIRRDVALEVNTSCYRSMATFLPDKEILKWYRELGGRLITLGSDAHKTEDAAQYFKEAATLLQDLGFREVYAFYKKKPVAFPL